MMNAVESIFADAVADRLSHASTWEIGARHWPSSERQTLTCARVIDETHDVKTFEFRTQDGMPVRFEPGQFMTVCALVGGQTIERCYTIASPPTRPFLVAITVKRVPGGIMSNWLHEHLTPGRELHAYGPSGVFTSTVSAARKVLYLSAGSGITPLISMTRASIDLGLDRDIAFVHSARTPADIVFRDELARLSKIARGLKLYFVCEGIGDERAWNGATGRLDLGLLTKWLPDYADRDVFTCGPAGYMNAVRGMLREGGHDPARYHQESFDIATNDVAVTSEATHNTFTVTLARSSRSFTMKDSETVLAAARRAGVAVPSSCSQGVCGTCKSRLVQGEVDMKHNGGIREREVQKGWRLLCCSRPASDLVLDL
jgi:glycine betaine catabolism B